MADARAVRRSPAHAALKIVEPAVEGMLSNKAILAVLWELFPDHPNLLPAYFSRILGGFRQKTFFSREGANISFAARAARYPATNPTARRVLSIKPAPTCPHSISAIP